MVGLAPTFDDHIAIVATESPHAAILDWWRRLDRAAQDHFALCHGRAAKNHRELEQHIATYPNLGVEVSTRITSLRRRRNAVAHEDVRPLSPDEADSYARGVFYVIGALVRA